MSLPWLVMDRGKLCTQNPLISHCCSFLSRGAEFLGEDYFVDKDCASPTWGAWLSTSSHEETQGGHDATSCSNPFYLRNHRGKAG